MNEFEFTVTEDLVGIRLDKALASHEKIESRSKATSLIDRGFVTCNGKTIKPSHKTSLGEVFHVHIPMTQSLDLAPYDFPLDVVFEDAHLLIVNKPSGLVVHPAFGHEQDTLVNALLHRYTNLSAGFASFRPGLVHRIDKDTSGLLVIAKDEQTLSGLAGQFKRKQTHRIYKAITFGSFKNPSGTITSYLRRHPTDRKKFASEKLTDSQKPTGRLAITHYDVVKSHPSGLTLLNLRLETGRTHQIRVHLSENHNPIVGDPVYCNETRYKSLKAIHLRKLIASVPQMLLHAAELGFIHPISKEEMLFKMDWPKQVHSLLDELEFNHD